MAGNGFRFDEDEFEHRRSGTVRYAARLMQGCVHNCFVRIAVPGNRRRLIAGIGNLQTECLEVDRMTISAMELCSDFVLVVFGCLGALVCV